MIPTVKGKRLTMMEKRNNPVGIIIIVGLLASIVTGLTCYTLLDKSETPIEKVRQDLNLIRLTLLIGLLGIGTVMIYGATA